MYGEMKKENLVSELEKMLTGKIRTHTSVVSNDFLSDLLDALNHSLLEKDVIEEFFEDGEINIDSVDSEVENNFVPFDGFSFIEKTIPKKGDKVRVIKEVLYCDKLVALDSSEEVTVIEWFENKEFALLHFDYLDGDHNIYVFVSKHDIALN